MSGSSPLSGEGHRRHAPRPPVPRGWWQSGQWGTSLLVLYVALAALPVGLAYAVNPGGGENFLMELGKAAGLIGFSLLALQVALSARLRFLDAPFGLDVVMQFHKTMAIFAGVLLLGHPVLLAAGGHGLWLFSLETPWQIILGKVALVLLVLIIGLALAFKKLGIEYQLWRYTHKAAVLVVIVGFAHGLVIGPDLQSTGPRAYWWLLLGLSVGLFAYRNAYAAPKGGRQLDVISVEPETHDTYTVAMQPRDGEALSHLPGQFVFLRLDRPGRPSEEHPFTISSSPTAEPPLTVTVKQVGDFTNTIHQTRPGDTARMQGPYGRFTFFHHDPPKLLFIAGGVGITPIRSMLAYLRDTGDARPAVLLYGNETEDDIIFRRELDGLPDNVKVVHVLTHPPEGWKGHSGYVTEEVIRREAGELLDEAHVYLCGPAPMMDNVTATLTSLGVGEDRIHYERFGI